MINATANYAFIISWHMKRGTDCVYSKTIYLESFWAGAKQNHLCRRDDDQKVPYRHIVGTKAC